MKRYLRWSLCCLAGVVCVPAKDPPSTAAASGSPEIATDELYQMGAELFNTLAPDEVKEQFDFPDRAQWNDFLGRLQGAQAGNDPKALAVLEPDAKAALAVLRVVPGGAPYVAWLERQLDDMEAAKELPPATAAMPARGKLPVQFVPGYDQWLRRLQLRPRPALADDYVVRLQPAFTRGGVPGELVWLAEVESGFSPTARSPSGARGLFQLMPATARELGLRTFLPDERTDPELSAQAAARFLRGLYGRFGDWPLALAAYNAGAGRVQRTLDQKRARSFAEIASTLPVETRLYVPKVLAVLKARTGLSLAGPGRPPP